MLRINFPDSILNFKLTYCDNSYNNGKLNMENTTFGYVISKTNFTTNTQEVKDYLSSYGTLFDGVNFYINEDMFSKYSYENQLQIIMCEYLNFFGFYYTSNRKMNDRNKEIIQSENLFYLSCMGLTKFVSAAQSIRRKLIPYYIKKYDKLDVIVFPPNENSLNYLFNLMIQGHDGIMKYFPGYRLNNEKYIYIDVPAVQLYGSANSRHDGIACYSEKRYDYKTQKYLYIRRIYVWDKIKNALAKKSSEDYREFTDAINMMETLSF